MPPSTFLILGVMLISGVVLMRQTGNTFGLVILGALITIAAANSLLPQSIRFPGRIASSVAGAIILYYAAKLHLSNRWVEATGTTLIITVVSGLMVFSLGMVHFLKRSALTNSPQLLKHLC